MYPIFSLTAAERLTRRVPDCYKALTEMQLPEPVCDKLLALLSANRGCGLPAIVASANLKRLVTMSREEIVAIYEAEYGTVGAGQPDQSPA